MTVREAEAGLLAKQLLMASKFNRDEGVRQLMVKVRDPWNRSFDEKLKPYFDNGLDAPLYVERRGGYRPRRINTPRKMKLRTLH